ncbi:thioredoxin fold domain-containing protein [Suttonella sp. R2A3]|uniref:thioredoxin fold domain-containing protein n=1 Tax=Suttonella sp. R2A3 TaxID=2908648 RepID=UPI001F238B8F|nr:thioredoxin fold domain-containing protein [Suttonella sp. R2A3]UJF24841.1 thioredoxin fold domain-containing protein [Suttonella sp. R2A3]
MHFFRMSAAACLLSAMGLTYAEPNLNQVKEAFSRYEIGEVNTTPVDGLYRFNVGTEVYYLSEDGNYLFQGEMIDLNARKNLSEAHRESARKALLDSADPKDMIIFPAQGESKHVVNVFTDVDCPYCRLLHKNISDYTEQGIEVRYLAFPGGGLGSDSHRKAVSVWCDKDRQKAITDAMAGGEVKTKSCDAPVEKQYKLGVEMGVRGTPAFILENGALVGGLVKPELLLRDLEAIEQN